MGVSPTVNSTLRAHEAFINSLPTKSIEIPQLLNVRVFSHYFIRGLVAKNKKIYFKTMTKPVIMGRGIHMQCDVRAFEKEAFKVLKGGIDPQSD